MAPTRAVAYWTSTHSRAVGAPDPDAVTLLDAGREEGEGQVVDRGVELAVRQAHVLKGDDERLLVGEAGGGAPRFSPIVWPMRGTADVPCT